MVIASRDGDAKADRHEIEKAGANRVAAELGEEIADMEEKLVRAQDVIAFQQGLVGSAVFVCRHRFDQHVSFALDLEEIDLQVRGGAAVKEVKDVGGELGHRNAEHARRLNIKCA